MGRPAKPARLYLSTTTNRPPEWVIRHGPLFVRTGLPTDELEQAQRLLNQYLFDLGLPEDWRRPVHVKRERRATSVYFASCDFPDHPIKIGIAVDVSRRLANLQTAMPYRVIVLGTMPGGAENERNLHNWFGKDRLEGEWFRRTPELMEFIQGNCARGGTPVL